MAVSINNGNNNSNIYLYSAFIWNNNNKYLYSALSCVTQNNSMWCGYKSHNLLSTTNKKKNHFFKIFCNSEANILMKCSVGTTCKTIYLAGLKPQLHHNVLAVSKWVNPILSPLAIVDLSLIFACHVIKRVDPSYSHRCYIGCG